MHKIIQTQYESMLYTLLVSTNMTQYYTYTSAQHKYSHQPHGLTRLHAVPHDPEGPLEAAQRLLAGLHRRLHLPGRRGHRHQVPV